MQALGILPTGNVAARQHRRLPQPEQKADTDQYRLNPLTADLSPSQTLHATRRTSTTGVLHVSDLPSSVRQA